MDNRIEIENGSFVVGADLIGSLLDLPPERVPDLLRDKAITSFCERGEAEDAGAFRLNFFYRNRRARLNVDAAGCVRSRSVIDFHDQPLPRSLHRPGG